MLMARRKTTVLTQTLEHSTISLLQTKQAKTGCMTCDGKVVDGVCWAAEMFCNTRLVFFFVDNVSSVFVKSVFKSSASLSDVLAVFVSVM